MKDLVELFDSIGNAGPILILLINIHTFLYRKQYLYVYLISIVFNSFLNSSLKYICRIPRQSDQIPFSKHENFDGVNAYGMPSGHAQSVFFSTMFLYLGQADSYSRILAAFICCLTLIQRYKYRRHTAYELVIGSFIGMCLAYAIFNTTSHCLKTRVHNTVSNECVNAS